MLKFFTSLSLLGGSFGAVVAKTQTIGTFIGNTGPLGDLGTRFDGAIYSYFLNNFSLGGAEYLDSIVAGGPPLGVDMEKKFGKDVIKPKEDSVVTHVSNFAGLLWDRVANLISGSSAPEPAVVHSVHPTFAAIQKEMREIVGLGISDETRPYRIHRFVASDIGRYAYEWLAVAIRERCRVDTVQ